MPFAWGIGNAMNRASTDVLFKQDVPTIKGEDFRTDLSPEEYKKAMGEGWQKLGATLNLKNTPLEDYDDAKDDYFDFNLKSLPDVRFKATPRWIEQEVEKLVKGEGESAGTLQKVKNRRRIPGYDFKSTNIINGKEFGGYTNLSESQAKLFRETFANVLMPQTLWTYIGNK